MNIRTSELFEGHMEALQGASQSDIKKAKELYEFIVKKYSDRDRLDESWDSERIDEGILTGLLGGVSGAVLGPTVMKAVAHALGVTSGPLYNLLTSSLVCSAVSYTLCK